MGLGLFDSIFGSNGEDSLLNFGHLKPGYFEACERLQEATTNFYNNEAIISCSCPKCNAELKFSPYLGENLINDGVLFCKSCDHYIGYSLRSPGNSKTHVLLKVYDAYEEVDFINKMDNYLAKNISVDDWRIIIGSIKIDNKNAAQYKRIKAILESQGVVFDEENDNKGE